MNQKDKSYNDIPASYFENFQDRLKTQIELEELLGDNKTSGYTVPEGYFDTLSRKLNTIPSNQNSTTKVISLNSKNWFWPSIGIAASILFLFVLFAGNGTTEENSLDLEDIALYLEVESANLQTGEITDLLTDEDINTILAAEDTSQEEDDLINYLEIHASPYDLLIE